MATSLVNQYISASFDKVVQISGSQLADGTGALISSLDVTASNATQAVSSSFATTASYAEYAVSASYEITHEVSSSYAESASYADFAVSASHSEFADQAATSYFADSATSASYAANASTADSATSASYSSVAVSSSYATSAGSAGSATTAVSSSHALSADNSISSSHSVSALSSSYANTSTSASHALAADTSISSSYASNASTADLATLATNATYSQNTIVTGKNITGSPITKGTPLFFTDSGTAGNIVGIEPADAGNAAKMPAGGIAGEAIAAGAEGIVLIDGYIVGVDTSLFGAGDEVFVGVGGGYTNVAPTGSANLVQKLGNVEKSAVNGSGVINGPGAVRSVPNIAQNNLWLGDANGVAQAVNQNTLSVASAVSSSYATNAATASFVSGTVISASYANNASTADSATVANSATSASYASTSQVSNTIKIYPDGSTSTRYLTYVDAYLSGDVILRAENALTYNPGTDTLTVGNVNGNLTGTASSATSASHALVSDTVNDGNVAYINQDNTFTGTQTFNNIQVNGTGSFAYISSVTGSAKIIGDAFIILNNDTPVQNFAGVKVQDSGSNTTASLQFDGANNNWFYEYEGGDHNFGLVMFGPEYTDINSPAYLTTNKLPKANGGHHFNDSNISDSGTLIVLGSNTEITGSLGVSGGITANVTGNLTGNADTATSASYSTTTLSSSYASEANALTAGDKSISGTLTATKVVITGGTGNDLIVSGTVETTLGMFPKGGILTGNVGGLRTFAGDYGFYNASGSDNSTLIGITVDNAGYGNTGWDGPAIWGNDPTDSYPALIGFQRKNNWTDGRVTFITPLSASAGIIGDLTGNASTATSASHAINADTAISSSYAATSGDAGSWNGLYVGDAKITGSLVISGSSNPFNAKFANLTAGQETEILSYENVVDQKGSPYTVARTLYQNYNFGSPYDHSFATEFWDSYSYNYGVEWTVGPRAIQGYLDLSGSQAGNLGIMRVREYGTTGQTEMLLSAYTASFFGTGNAYVGSTGDVFHSSVNENHNLTGNLFVTASSAQILASGYNTIQGSDIFLKSTFGLEITGSVRGEVDTLSISSATASLDCQTGNFFNLTLVSGSDTYINPTNIKPGQTINIKVAQPNPGFGTVSFPSSVKQVSGSAYVPSEGNSAVDIVTLISFDDSNLYLSNVKNLL